MPCVTFGASVFIDERRFQLMSSREIGANVHASQDKINTLQNKWTLSFCFSALRVFNEGGKFSSFIATVRNRVRASKEKDLDRVRACALKTIHLNVGFLETTRLLDISSINARCFNFRNKAFSRSDGRQKHSQTGPCLTISGRVVYLWYSQNYWKPIDKF